MYVVPLNYKVYDSGSKNVYLFVVDALHDSEWVRDIERQLK
jgi:hypothetical protein